ncbi:hypothetical protein NHX12_023658 [Muraenolepis orangiensis]|uniref:Uncharacterized protein n=1 Tax=Muraenolepis orangiensis TaxID=630683 RepID=A0A9Q0EL62_9TELE|nr:hypothetical protein NHX12_023658 [Muraenolepis orangiensis]
MGLGEEVMGFEEEVMGLGEEVMGFEEEVMGLEEEVMGFEEEVMGLGEEVMGLEEEPIQTVDLKLLPEAVSRCFRSAAGPISTSVM